MRELQSTVAFVLGTLAAFASCRHLNQGNPDVGSAVFFGLTSLGFFLGYAALKIAAAIEEKKG